MSKMTRIAIISREKCKPTKCNFECGLICPVNRQKKDCVKLVDIEDVGVKKMAKIDEKLCTGCGLCANSTRGCPFGAVMIVNVPTELSSEIVNRYGLNGFRLYRKDEREKWLYLLKSWSNYARRNGYDLYYYDLPTWVKFDVDIIRPVSVDIMNFIFFGLSKYKIKGLYIYGCSEWSVCGVNNYVLSKKIWNPDLDANSIVREYFYLAYGKVLYSYINRIYNIFDDAYKRYYVNNENASYKITRKHLIEIYSKNQIEIESILDVALVLAVAEGDASHIDNVKRLDSQIRRIRQILLARNIPIK